jgi:hypothetical protein
MDWLGDLLNFGASAASGGILGILGAFVGGVFKFFQKRQEMEEAARVRDHELSLQRLQMEARKAETEQEILLANSQGSWEGLAASVRADASLQTVSGWVNNARALYRLFLTTLLWGLTAWIAWLILDQRTMHYLTTADAAEIIKQIIRDILFCAATATTWWFGDRAIAQTRSGK